MKKILIMPIIFLLQGCVTASVFNVSEADIGNVTDDFLSKSSFNIIDEQLMISAPVITEKVLLEGRRIDASMLKKQNLKIHFKRCLVETPFYKTPKSILSLVTVSIVPFGSTYACETVVEYQDLESGKNRVYSLNQQYIQSYGILHIFRPEAYFASSLNISMKKSIAFLGISEAGKNE